VLTYSAFSVVVCLGPYAYAGPLYIELVLELALNTTGSHSDHEEIVKVASWGSCCLGSATQVRNLIWNSHNVVFIMLPQCFFVSRSTKPHRIRCERVLGIAVRHISLSIGSPPLAEHSNRQGVFVFVFCLRLHVCI
jgi:hypothetical protein